MNRVQLATRQTAPVLHLIRSLMQVQYNNTQYKYFFFLSREFLVFSSSPRNRQNRSSNHYSSDKFQVSASEMYISNRMNHMVTRWFTMLNRLRYPAIVSFEIDGPFRIKSVKTMRCGIRPGNAEIRVHYEDLVEVYKITNNLKCLLVVLFYAL